MIGNLIIAGFIIAAGVAAFRLWKAKQAITANSVLAGVKSEVKEAAAAVSPAIQAVIEKAVAEALAKALTPKP